MRLVQAETAEEVNKGLTAEIEKLKALAEVKATKAAKRAMKEVGPPFCFASR